MMVLIPSHRAANCGRAGAERLADAPLALKVGVHHGPAIAMTANDHLDYFGRTVNLAARVADQGHGGDVVVLREVLDQADQSLFQGRGDIRAEPFTTQLRGLAQDQRLVRLTVGTARPGAAQKGALSLAGGHSKPVS